jgi:hypothetical protein
MTTTEGLPEGLPARRILLVDNTPTNLQLLSATLHLTCESMKLVLRVLGRLGEY